MIKADFIWMDGKLVEFKEAKIHVLSHSLHYANAVFEGLRAYKSDKGLHIFRLHDHTRRLLESAKITKIKPNFSFDELNAAQIEVVKANNFKDKVYIRPLIYLGEGVMGISHANAPVRTAIAAWEWEGYLGKDALDKGIKAKISSFRKNSEGFNRCKATANYLLFQMAKLEALDAGYDEAILLDANACVAEGSSECLFMAKNGVLITPPSPYALKSITQDTVINLAKDLGLEVLEKNITRDELYTADEAFFTGTAAEITPIFSIDERIMKDGVGKITKAIQNEYFSLVYAKNDKYSHYLTKIN